MHFIRFLIKFRLTRLSKMLEILENFGFIANRHAIIYRKKRRDGMPVWITR